MKKANNLEKVKELAPDLANTEPRPAHMKLAGFSMAARTLDKCRASLAGSPGEFKFGCPMDQQFFSEAGIDANEFKEFVATGANDKEVEEWLARHAAKSGGASKAA